LEISPGQDAWVANTPFEFASAILSLLNDVSKREEMGNAGRAYVERAHDWDRVAAQLEQIYDRAIQAQQRSYEVH
jgi:glycosyltransferase involved in cell wall biosynthesis